MEDVGGSICDAGRPRDITEAAVCCPMTCDAGRDRVAWARGGDVLLGSSDACSACALLLVTRSSGMERAAASDKLLIPRLCVVVLRELVVREGITGAPGIVGPPALGDCGSLLEPVRLRPDSGSGILDGLEGVPVRAASESARAASASVSSSLSVSLDMLRICISLDILRVCSSI